MNKAFYCYFFFFLFLGFGYMGRARGGKNVERYLHLYIETVMIPSIVPPRAHPRIQTYIHTRTRVHGESKRERERERPAIHTCKNESVAEKSTVEYPRVQHLVPPDPQVHDGHALPGRVRGRAPLAVDDGLDGGLHGAAGEHLLRLEGPEDARAHGGRDERLDVAQDEDVGGLARAEAHDGGDGAEEGA